MDEKIFQWNEIKQDFKDTLIVGNGASIAVSNSFSNKSLYDEASHAALLNPAFQTLFDHYSTKDFEFVLRLIWRAHQINKLFDVEDHSVAEAYWEIRDCLIKTVQRVHVDYSEAAKFLPSMAGFLRRFKIILSLNYDLLIYWAMLHGNNALGGNWFKDGFGENRAFMDDFHFLKKPHGKMEGATLVFYPHGNLALATNILGQEIKICNEDTPDILDTIVGKWNFDVATPLFVSEGNSEQKFQAIHRHGYLRIIYNDVLKKLQKEQKEEEGDSVCIYGWSISGQDSHILKAIGENRPQKLAVSVYTGSGNGSQFCKDVRALIEKAFGFKFCEILFFDAQSEDCWIKCSPIS